MFVQVIRARVRDRAAAESVLDRWATELRPGAIGFLGSTSGITPGGELVVAARFTDADAARRNSERPEQSAWWQELERTFEGEPEFLQATEVDEFLGGGSDQAGFVQVIRGHAKDREQARRALVDMEGLLRQHRPDIIGGYIAWHGDRDFTEVVYFSSEAEARRGEAAMPAELREPSDRAAVTFDDYMDLPTPRMTSRST